MITIVKLVVGVAVGGVMGFLYYRFVGCSSGACPLTSNPWTSTLYGMLIGGLVSGSLR